MRLGAFKSEGGPAELASEVPAGRAVVAHVILEAMGTAAANGRRHNSKSEIGPAVSIHLHHETRFLAGQSGREEEGHAYLLLSAWAEK